MHKETRQYRLAVMALMGTMIGVGIFGVPFALSKAGAAACFVYMEF
jgi:amino acid permease